MCSQWNSHYSVTTGCSSGHDPGDFYSQSRTHIHPPCFMAAFSNDCITQASWPSGSGWCLPLGDIGRRSEAGLRRKQTKYLILQVLAVSRIPPNRSSWHLTTLNSGSQCVHCPDVLNNITYSLCSLKMYLIHFIYEEIKKMSSHKVLCSSFLEYWLLKIYLSHKY